MKKKCFCQRLKEYAEFVALIRENIAQGVDVQEAIHMAMGQAMKKGLLTDVLSRCETEVATMLLEEFDMEEVKACWKKQPAEHLPEQEIWRCFFFHKRDMMNWRRQPKIRRIR